MSSINSSTPLNPSTDSNVEFNKLAKQRDDLAKRYKQAAHLSKASFDSDKRDFYAYVASNFKVDVEKLDNKLFDLFLKRQ